MELTINIKEQAKQAFIIKLLQEFEYIEIVDIKEDESFFDKEHLKFLKKRIERLESGETTFKSWDIIKKKYEKKAL